MLKYLLILLLLIPVFGYAQSTEKNTNNHSVTGFSYQSDFFEDKQRIQKLIDFKPAVDSIYHAFANERNIPGLAYGVVYSGQLQYFNGFGTTNIEKQYPVTEKSMFRIASMSKSFVAMAIMKLKEEGNLHVYEKAVKYLPELKHLKYLTNDANPISIENLLTMSSGFPEDNPWADRQLEMSEDEFTELLKGGFSFSNNPSTGYEYSNLGFAMLGRIISNISGIPYQEYISKNIFLPLGMTNTSWEYDEIERKHLALGYRYQKGEWIKEPMLHDGAFGAIGGIITSLEDFSKYVAYLLSAYPFRNDPESGPISRSSLRQMQTTGSIRFSPDAVDADGNACPKILGYAYGLRTELFCDGFKNVGHSGGLPGFGSHYYILPDYGLGIISFANLTYGSPWRADDEVIHQLRKRDVIQARKMVVSHILKEKKEQIVEYLRSKNRKLADQIFAENFFLDQPEAIRNAEFESIFHKSGEILSSQEIIPENQLRGSFILTCLQKNIEVYFTLSPEAEPKIQKLVLNLIEH